MPDQSIAFAAGMWLPDRDPARIGEQNFSVMQNLRYTDGAPIGVNGFRLMCLTAYPFLAKFEPGKGDDGHVVANTFNASADFAYIGDPSYYPAVTGDDGYAISAFNSTFDFARIGAPVYTAITYVSGDYEVYFANPSGLGFYQPAAGFPTGYRITFFNKGTGDAIFDPDALAYNVGSGQAEDFYFDGTNWV